MYSKPCINWDCGGMCIYINTSLPSSVLKRDDIIMVFKHLGIIISPVDIPKQCIVSMYQLPITNIQPFLTESTDFLCSLTSFCC